MSHRCLAAVLTVIAVVALTPMFAAAQSTDTTAPPRTPWGAPDLQGVWDFRSITPMERPEELADQEFLTEEEAANLEQETVNRNESPVEPAGSEDDGYRERGQGGGRRTGLLQQFLAGPRHNDPSGPGARRWSWIRRTDAFRP